MGAGVHTIKSAGGDYLTLNAWEAGEQCDLTGLGDSIADCYNVADTTVFTLLGWTSTANDKIWLRATSTVRHGYFWDINAYRLTTTNDALTINEDFVLIDGLQIYLNSSGSSRTGIYVSGVSAGCSIIIKNCIIRVENNGNTGCDGITISDADATVSIRNCVIYQTDAITTSSDGVIKSAGTAISVYNTVCWGFEKGLNGIHTVSGCALFNNTDDMSICPSVTYTGSDDNDVIGTGNYQITQTANGYEAYVVSASGGDFRPTSSLSELVGSAFNLTATFTDDCVYQTRPTTGPWDGGAFQLSGVSIFLTNPIRVIYEGTKSTDKEFPIIMVSSADERSAETGLTTSDITILYSYENTSSWTTYTPAAADWTETGRGLYWLSLGAAEFSSNGKYVVTVISSGCMADMCVIEVKDSGISSLTAQNIRDAMKLAASAGAPAEDSIDDYLTELQSDTANILVDTSNILGYVNEVESLLKDGTYGLSALNTDLDALLARLTAARAGYLDNLNIGGLVASSAIITALPAAIDVQLSGTHGAGAWGGGSSLTRQDVRDAMLLAPTPGDPATDSIDYKLDNLIVSEAALALLIKDNYNITYTVDGDNRILQRVVGTGSNAKTIKHTYQGAPKYKFLDKEEVK